MNLLTFGSVTGVALGALYPVVNYFIPPRAAGSGGGTTAKDELGNTVTASGWLSTHKEGDRSLVQGLKGDPTYLIVEGDDAIGSYEGRVRPQGEKLARLGGGAPGKELVEIPPVATALRLPPSAMEA